MPSGYTFVDANPVDDGQPYVMGWDLTNWGKTASRPPTIQSTAGGSYTAYPLITNLVPRQGKLAVYAQSTDELNKRKVESDLRALLQGQRRLHLAGKFIDVFLSNAEEVGDDSKKAARLIGIVADFVAPIPLWSLNQPIKGVSPNAPVNAGAAYGLWNDGTIPALIPAYKFAVNTFTMNNWGNAFTYAAGTITAGPINTTVYLRGSGSTVVAVPLDGTGAGTFLATSLLYLAPGNNTIRVEDVTTALVTVGGSFVLSFGDTYMRYY
jgi:hypothetical protein